MKIFLIENFFSKDDLLKIQKIICDKFLLEFNLDYDKNLKEFNKYLKSLNNKKLSLLYDSLNSSTKLRKFISHNRFFTNRLKKKLKMKRLRFFNFQLLLMKPKSNKENLGWHTDSYYFSKFKKKGFVIYFNIMNENRNSIDVVKNTKFDDLEFKENVFYRRKKTKLNQRGHYYIKNNFRKNQITSCKLNTYDLLVFDKDLVHKSAKSTFVGFRMTYIIRLSN